MTKLQYLKSLTKLLLSKNKKWELQTGHTVEIAFYSGGEPYYKLSDLFNTFTERGLDAYQVYEEISMRIAVDDLKLFINKFKELCNSNPIQILEVSKALNFLEERVNFVIPPRDLIWKMASVAYFDESESPYTYDAMYAQKKIKLWQENKDIADFFLYQQLKALIPLPELSSETYKILQETISKILNHQYGSMNISGKQSETYAENSISNEKQSEQSIV